MFIHACSVLRRSPSSPRHISTRNTHIQGMPCRTHFTPRHFLTIPAYIQSTPTAPIQDTYPTFKFLKLVHALPFDTPRDTGSEVCSRLQGTCFSNLIGDRRDDHEGCESIMRVVRGSWSGGKIGVPKVERESGCRD